VTAAKAADRSWLNTTQAAEYLGVHRDTILKAANGGALKSARIGDRGWRRYHRDWLDDWWKDLSERSAS